MGLNETDQVLVVLEALDPAEVSTTRCAAANARLEKDDFLLLGLEIGKTFLEGPPYLVAYSGGAGLMD